MLNWRSVTACCSALALSVGIAAPALATDKPIDLKKAKSAATKQAHSKGRARYPYDTFTVSVNACKRESRFKASCKAAIRGVASCLEDKCAPLGPGLYKETCRWTSLVTAFGKGHRQLRTSTSGFKCELGEALPDG